MEHTIQRAVVQAMRANGYMSINTDVFFGLSMAGSNQVKRAAYIGNLKNLGATVGTPDLIFLKRNEILFVEMKDGSKGKLSQAQKDCIAKLTKWGFNVQVWRDLGDCIAYLDWSKSNHD